MFNCEKVMEVTLEKRGTLASCMPAEIKTCGWRLQHENVGCLTFANPCRSRNKVKKKQVHKLLVHTTP